MIHCRDCQHRKGPSALESAQLLRRRRREVSSTSTLLVLSRVEITRAGLSLRSCRHRSLFPSLACASTRDAVASSLSRHAETLTNDVRGAKGSTYGKPERLAPRLQDATTGGSKSGDRNASRAQGLPGTHITLPSTSSKLAVLTVLALAPSSVHRTNKAAVRSEIPGWYELWRSSNPTHVTASPPALLTREGAH